MTNQKVNTAAPESVSLTEIRRRLFWIGPALSAELLAQRSARGRPTCVGSGSGSVGRSRGRQGASPRWTPCPGSACSTASPLVTAAATDCLRPMSSSSSSYPFINVTCQNARTTYIYYDIALKIQTANKHVQNLTSTNTVNQANGIRSSKKS